MKMLRIFFFAFAIFGLGLTTACDSDTPAEDAKEDIEEATEEVGDVFRTEQEELRKDLKDMQAEINEEMNELEQNMENASADAKAEMQEEMNQLQAWSQQIGNDLERIEGDVEQGWDKLKGNVRSSLNEIEREWNENFDDAD